MKFEFDNEELDILDEELPEDNNSILNYCKTMAGHTLMIDPRFKLVKTAIPNVYLLKENKK